MGEVNEQKVRILLEGGTGEIEEKKSRFIAHIAKTESEEEAVAFIESIRKKYWDARHNCSAMVIGEHNELTRCSDDGEPSGTAGRPMLEVLTRENLHNVTVVVTRYFGGTLLGTGGLVRAYTQAVKEGLENCKIGVLRKGVELLVVTDYNDVGKVLYFLENKGLKPVESEYTDKVMLKLVFPVEMREEMSRQLTEITSGKAKLEVLGEISYVDKEND